jgi:DegV family protein with EDD domain
VRQVGVVTDSTACIPPDIAASLEIEVLPLVLAFGDKVYEDGTAEVAEFYETLRTAPHPPTTSAPPPAVYANAILRAGREASAVLCVTVSRQFSVMYDAAVQGAALARHERPDLDVRVLDSGAAAMAQGFIALTAARAAADGGDIDGVLARAQEVMPKVQLVVMIDTLTYLARTGRVPRLVIWAASPFKVRPIVAYESGSYRPITIARTRPAGIERVFEELRRRAGGRRLHVCVQHTNSPFDAAVLAERVRAELDPAELLTSEFTQVMGVHIGPGLVGFSFYTE